MTLTTFVIIDNNNNNNRSVWCPEIGNHQHFFDTVFDRLAKGALLRLFARYPFTKVSKNSRPTNALGLSFRLIKRVMKHVRERLRERGAPVSHQSYARIVCAPAPTVENQSFAKHQAPRAVRGGRDRTR